MSAQCTRHFAAWARQLGFSQFVMLSESTQDGCSIAQRWRRSLKDPRAFTVAERLSHIACHTNRWVSARHHARRRVVAGNNN